MTPLRASLLVILAAVVFAAWFYSSHEKVWEDYYVGFSGEAARNDYLAAERLLRELGFEAESRLVITPSEWLPERYDTLFVQLSSPLATAGEKDAILYWVGEGGHLVLLPPRDDSPVIDEFLEEFGLRLVAGTPAPAVDADEDTEAAAEERAAAERELAERNEYRLTGGRPYQQIELVGTSAKVVEHFEQVIAARVGYGEGYVSLVSGPWYFTNDYLDNLDNARLFADLVVGEHQPRKVWLTFGAAFTPLWELIWQNAMFVVLAALLLLLLWLWNAIPRFGPRVRETIAARRSIVEHIAASGTFVWRRHGADSLVDGAVTALVHDADAIHPGIARQPAERQVAIIARVTGLKEDEIKDALYGGHDTGQREFTRSMQRLQTIRKEL